MLSIETEPGENSRLANIDHFKPSGKYSWVRTKSFAEVKRICFTATKAELRILTVTKLRFEFPWNSAVLHS
jgi:hypothetical protein